MDVTHRLTKVVYELEAYISSLTPEDAIWFQAPGAVVPDRESLENSTIFISNENKAFELSTRICGFPGFCTHDAYSACSNMSLIQCDKCGVTRASVFLFFTLVTGLLIIVGNLMVIAVSIRRHQNRTLDKMDICKASFSTADFIVGNFMIKYFTYTDRKNWLLFFLVAILNSLFFV